MNTSDNHNDPLEQFFRDKAEEFDITYREKDWQDLEKRLDHQQAIASYQKRIRWIAAAAVFIVSVLGYFIYDNTTRLSKLDEQIIQNDSSQIVPDSTMRQDSNPALPQTGNPENLASNQSVSTSSDSTSERIIAEQTTHPVENIIPSSKDKHEQITRQDFQIATLDVPKATGKSNSLPPISNKIVASLSGDNFGSNIQTEIKERNNFKSSAMSLGIVGSPDMSTVGKLSNFDQPGYKFGLSVSYALNNAFSISTGLISSKVRYTSENNYHYPSQSYLGNGNAPSQLIAECIILDIPINLEYNLITLTSSRFFITTGISNYIMLNERYQFNYSYDRQGQIDQKNLRSGKAYLLSNVNFSIGYEVDLHEHFSLRAEPFIKAPLRNVGWGEVKLYSVGSFISLRYRF